MDETTVILGALKLSGKVAKNCMTPLDKVFMLEINTPIYEAVEQVRIRWILLEKNQLSISFKD